MWVAGSNPNREKRLPTAALSFRKHPEPSARVFQIKVGNIDGAMQPPLRPGLDPRREIQTDSTGPAWSQSSIPSVTSGQ
ncbi:hypothetical protein AJ87_13360 [Rhizobium yanglingense]|nr:hypothetical protein AJ87_13360 [Rhizobium yanglingense]